MKKKITLIAIFLLICVVSYGQNSYNLNEDRNWITSTSYDLNGNITSTGVSYFNLLGKATQSHSLDLKTGKIWVNEVRVWLHLGANVFCPFLRNLSPESACGKFDPFSSNP